ncbi:hypothetical protein [Pseudomonas sp.]|uniref:hypothetical protein n=1 Tax=Pseudomonas sp. TaxID=306 RepID=UPI00258D9415|nr:hypothetical protein [Pseudomonas sp.]
MFDKTPTPFLPALQEDPAIEIEIEDPESVGINVGDVEIMLRPEPETADDFGANLADFIEEGELNGLANDLIDDFDKDCADRKEWVTTYIEGLKLLGLKYEDRSDPWAGACGVFHPMLTEAVVRFQSEAMTETFPASGPVKTQIVGRETPAKTEASTRVREDMNYQLTEVMPEYRTEHERLLWALPLAGSAFKKVYYDPTLGRQVAMFVPAEDLVVPYGASNLESAPRIAHVMRKTKNEMAKLMAAGFYSDLELGEPSAELDDVEKQKAEEQGMSAVSDDRYRVLEVHVDLDLPGFEDKDKDGKLTGIALPYVVSIEKGTGEVLSIRRNWLEDDTLHLRRVHFSHYQYVPGFGFYGYGLIHLIGGYAKSATMIMRQLVDAGTLANLPGGLKARGLRVKGDDTPISPGEFRDVDLASGSIRDNIMMLPYGEPSQVLYALFQNIVQEGRAFASGGDLKVSDMSANAPVGTTLALLERVLKVMTAVQARLHNSMRQEFKLLKAIIADDADESYAYEPEDGPRRARRSDYEMVEVLPVSDPNASTMAQKIVQYQAALQLAQGAPQLYNLPLLHRQMIEVLGLKNAAKLVPLEDDLTPIDPVLENQNILMSKPVKAFIEQDHKAHLTVHMAAMQDPLMAQMLGQNPMAQQLQAAAMAHIQEHLAMEYRRQVEERLGMPLPTEQETKAMDPAVAAKVAQLAAQAAQQVLQGNQQQAAQQAAQQQAQDPVVQMQQKELALREREVGIKEKKLQVDAATEADRIKLAEKQMQIDAATAADKIRLAERKQYASEEIDEQTLRVKTLHAGNMGRAQDQSILQADRKNALEALRVLSEIHAKNALGQSGAPAPDMGGAPPLTAPAAAPEGGAQ